jgi:hypothetical protein
MILSFELTMPNVGSWNGKWSGESNLYIKFRNIPKKQAEEIMQGKGVRDFRYNWDDGWSANVKVCQVDSSTKRNLEKRSKGFCGYDWMIDSIIKHDKIIASWELQKQES